MGILVDPYHPDNFPEFSLQAYICLDLYNPINIQRDVQNSSVYNMTATFRVYKSLADRQSSANKIIGMISKRIPSIDISGNVSEIAYTALKTEFTNAGATVTDEI